MMGRVSDMDQQQEGVDELLCEIDHWKERAEEAERMLSWMVGNHEYLLDQLGAPERSFAREENAKARAFLGIKK